MNSRIHDCFIRRNRLPKINDFMYFIQVTIVTLFRMLPEGVAIRLGILCGWILHRIVRFRYKIILNQVNVAFGKNYSEQKVNHLIKNLYRHLGLTLVELLRLPRITKREIQRKIIFHGVKIAEKAHAKGKGVIVLMGHIGNWELMGPAWVQKGYAINAVGKEMKSHAGNVFLRLMRDENGVTTIPRKNSIKEIIHALNRNEAIAVMLDQNMTAKEGVFVEFFGQQACTMPALAILAERCEATILPAYAYRDKDLIHHHIVILPEIRMEKKFEDFKSNIIHNTSRFTNVLENMVRQHPDQWLWIHKRWRTRPSEEKISVFNY